MLETSVSERRQWKGPINITKKQWMMLLEEKDIITEKDVQLLRLIYTCHGSEATASQLAQLLHIPYHVSLNSQVGRLGKRIVKKLNIPAPERKDGKGFNWWNVPFWGERRPEGDYWILRPELQEALREIDAEEASSIEISIPEEIEFDSHEVLYEGTIKQIFVNSYERNRGAREQCVKYYGTRCVVCGFDFQKTYGEVGREIIHVHHLKPLSDIGEEYRVDPINDLRPVCPNCHVVIHRKKPPYSLDEVMAMIITTRTE